MSDQEYKLWELLTTLQTNRIAMLTKKLKETEEELELAWELASIFAEETGVKAISLKEYKKLMELVKDD